MRHKPKAIDSKLADLEAANEYRDSLLDRADGQEYGRYPWWHGWAIVEAYLAGLEAGRKNPRT